MGKKEPEEKDKEQSARFIEVAERIQEEESWERFEEAVKNVLSAKPHRGADDDKS